MNNWVPIKVFLFFCEFNFIFSRVRTDIKIWLQNLWQRYRKPPVKLKIYVNFLVLFLCIVHVLLLTCSCHRLYSSNCFLPISFLYFNFSLPCLHRSSSIFSVESKSDSISASFYGSTFAHFSYSLRFWFSAFNIEFFEILLRQEVSC